MARKLNLVTPDLGAPDADFTDGFYLDEDVGVPGTPILADEKTSMYYFFSRLMSKAGFTFNGLVDSFTSSQFFDAFLNSASIQDKETLSASQTVAPGKFSKYYEVDTSGGTRTITLSDGEILNQKITIECNGSNLAYVKGTGIYDGAGALGTPISNGLVFTAIWNGSSWKPVEATTAVYVSGLFSVKQNSLGDMQLSYSETATIATQTVSGALFISGIQTKNFPLSFASTPTSPGIDCVDSLQWGSFASISTTDFQFRLYSTASASGSRKVETVIMGKY